MRLGRFESLLVVVAGLVVGAAATFYIKHKERTGTAQESASNVDAGEPDSGIQEAAVFIGASWCRGAASPELRDSLPILMTTLRAEAYARSHRFTSIGVSLDGSPETGIDWLTKYGQFDELDVGGGWGNYAVLSLIWGDSSSAPILPQLIILTREIATESPTKIKLGSLVVRERLYGTRLILRRLEATKKQIAS